MKTGVSGATAFNSSSVGRRFSANWCSVIRDDKFLAVGSEAEVRTAAPDARTIDAKGRRLIPGLIDSHIHLIRGGLNYNMELRWDGVPSLSEAMAMLKRQVDRTPAPQWVRVVGGFAPDLRAHAAAVVGKKDIDCIVSGGLDFDVDGTSLAIRKRVSDRIKEEVSQQLSVWSRVAVHFQTGLAMTFSVRLCFPRPGRKLTTTCSVKSPRSKIL